MEDSAKFCPACGSAVASQQPVEAPQAVPAAVQPPVETPAPAPEAAEAPVSAAEAPAEKPTKKKMGKFKKFLLVTVPVLAIVAALVIFNWNWIVGSSVKTFGSAGDYLAYVEGNSFKNTSGDIASVYGQILSVDGAEKTAFESELKLELGQSLQSMLSMSGADMSWLDSISVGMDFNVDGALSEYSVDLVISETEIVKIHVIFDNENKALYLGLPGLQSSYVKMDLASMGISSEDMAELESALASLEEYRSALPSEDELSDFLVRYMEIIVDCIDDAEMSDVKLTVAGVSQSVTQLAVTVDEELLADITRAVLTEAKTDETLRGIVSDISDAIAAETGESYDLLAEYDAAIAKFLAEMDNSMADGGNEVFFTLIDYVDSAHNVIGRRIESAGEGTSAYYAVVEDGSNMALVISVDDSTLVEGSFVKSGDLISGTVDIAGVDVTVKDFDLDALSDGHLKGTFRITLPEELLSSAGMGSGGLGFAVNYAVELQVSTSDEEVYMKISILSGDAALISLVYEGKAVVGDSITVPTQTVDGTDADSLSEWASGLDLAELQRRLQECGLGDLLETLMGSLAGELF